MRRHHPVRPRRCAGRCETVASFTCRRRMDIGGRSRYKSMKGIRGVLSDARNVIVRAGKSKRRPSSWRYRSRSASTTLARAPQPVAGDRSRTREPEPGRDGRARARSQSAPAARQNAQDARFGETDRIEGRDATQGRHDRRGRDGGHRGRTDILLAYPLVGPNIGASRDLFTTFRERLSEPWSMTPTPLVPFRTEWAGSIDRCPCWSTSRSAWVAPGSLPARPRRFTN